jgi:hypothetical protein
MNYKKIVRSSDPAYETFTSSSSLKENQSSGSLENKSKAYVAAMKALQDKIITIECYNSDLTEKLKASETRLAEEKREWEFRFLEERQNNESTERNLKQKIIELENIEKETKNSKFKTEEVIKFLEIKLKFNEDHIKRLEEQIKIDHENFQLEAECFKNSIKALETQEKALRKTLENEKREKKLALEEIRQQNMLITNLEDDLNFLRDNDNINRVKIEENFKSLKSELMHQNQENLQLIKKLNIKNKSLHKLASESKKQGEYYKIQCIKLSHQSKGSRDFGPDKKTTRSKSKVFDSRAKSTNRNSTPILGSYDQSNNLYAPNLDEENLIKAIKTTENEVQKLNEKYSRLQNAHLEYGELNIHKRNLENICVSMDLKSKELYALKKQLQDILLTKIKH